MFIESALPFEHITVSCGGRKMTGSPRKAFEAYWGEATARQFYHDKRLVSKYDFHLVWWDGAGTAMNDFPKMFRTYVTKNTSKFCGTNRQLSRWDPSVKNICLSCGKDDEPSEHITLCQDEGRVGMWRRSIGELTRWMSSTTTDISLMEMVEAYLLAQGTKTMSECVQVCSPSHQLLAEVHDKLGWQNFVAGRICKLYLQIVADSLNEQRPYATPESWGKRFVRLLMQAIHKQ